MSDYAFTGKKGTGKSKNAVRVARDTYFAEGRAVATNLDIYLKPMFGAHSKKTYIRVPDKPSEFDLRAAGHGNPESYNEEKNGALILDELGTWMNTRSFADKSRAGVLDFFAHARKYGWDCIYIMQNIVQVDKQLRESFIEYVVRHTRFDKVKIPFIGGLLCLLFGKKAGYFQRFHTAVSRIGVNPQDMRTDSVVYVAKDIEACYDTRQVFEENYPHGTHSVLSPWHVEGRFTEKPGLGWWSAFFNGLLGRSNAPQRVVSPMTRPTAGYARIVALVKLLPVDQRVAVLALYERGLQARAGGASAPPERAPQAPA